MIVGLRDFLELATAVTRTACVIRPLTLPLKECFLNFDRGYLTRTQQFHYLFIYAFYPIIRLFYLPEIII